MKAIAEFRYTILDAPPLRLQFECENAFDAEFQAEQWARRTKDTTLFDERFQLDYDRIVAIYA